MFFFISEFYRVQKFVSGVSKESEKLSHRGGYEYKYFIGSGKLKLSFFPFPSADLVVKP
jgi:hypothetical protein